MVTKNSLIVSMCCGVVTKELREPYVLSFTTVEQIDILWVCVQDESGTLGLGEAVPLFGYGEERIDDIVRVVNELRHEIIGRGSKQGLTKVTSLARKHPFAVSAVATALDFRKWTRRLDTITPTSLVYPIGAGPDNRQVARQIERGLAKGYHHFKMKVGRNLVDDIRSSRLILQEFARDDYTVRFDANQAYTLTQALEYCRSLEDLLSTGLLWVEQPLGKEDWEGMQELCRKTILPLMLDESIYDERDILRARKIGCAAVKLKLFKHPGMDACLKMVKTAHDAGLMVTVGNGVSSDIGNLCEALIIAAAKDLVVSGAECNGYAKLTDNIAFPQLQLQSGNLVWNGSTFISVADAVRALKEQSTQLTL